MVCDPAYIALPLLAGLVTAGMGRWEDSGTTAQGGRPTRRFTLADTVDLDRTPEIPKENEVVSTSTPSTGLENTEAVNGLLAGAAPEESEDWGAI